MLDLGKIREKERKLLQEKEKAEANLKRTQAQLKEAERKADSRKKIVLGGVILAAVQAGGLPAHFVARLVKDHASDRDKTLFVGTAFEVSESAGAEVPDAISRE